MRHAYKAPTQTLDLNSIPYPSGLTRQRNAEKQRNDRCRDAWAYDSVPVEGLSFRNQEALFDTAGLVFTLPQGCMFPQRSQVNIVECRISIFGCISMNKVDM